MPSAPILTDNVLNDALQNFLNAFLAYYPLLLLWGARLLTAAAFIGFGYAIFQAVLTRDWYSMFMSFLYVAVRLGLIHFAFTELWDLGFAFPEMGQIVGTSVSGLSPNILTPSGFYELGLHICGMLWHARTIGAWFNLVADIEFVTLIVVTQLTWFAAACIYMWYIIDCQWYVIKGPVTVCFAAFERTWPTFEAWFVQLLQVGIKMLAALLILAVGLLLANEWISILSGLGIKLNANPIQYTAVNLVEAIITFYALLRLPAKAAGIIRSHGGVSGDLGADTGREMVEASGRAARAGMRVVTGI
jgi:TrbL/VirB6 plasmid conjugal transfer protein